MVPRRKYQRALALRGQRSSRRLRENFCRQAVLQRSRLRPRNAGSQRRSAPRASSHHRRSKSRRSRSQRESHLRRRAAIRRDRRHHDVLRGEHAEPSDSRRQRLLSLLPGNLVYLRERRGPMEDCRHSSRRNLHNSAKLAGLQRHLRRRLESHANHRADQLHQRLPRRFRSRHGGRRLRRLRHRLLLPALHLLRPALSDLLSVSLHLRRRELLQSRTPELTASLTPSTAHTLPRAQQLGTIRPPERTVARSPIKTPTAATPTRKPTIRGPEPTPKRRKVTTRTRSGAAASSPTATTGPKRDTTQTRTVPSPDSKPRRAAKAPASTPRTATAASSRKMRTTTTSTQAPMATSTKKIPMVTGASGAMAAGNQSIPPPAPSKRRMQRTTATTRI